MAGAMMSIARVAHLVGSTGVYGAERWILALVRYLPVDRVRSVVVNLVDDASGPSALAREAKARDVPVLDLYTGGRFSPLGPWRLRRWLRETGVTILHMHGYKADAVGLAATAGTGIRTIATPHGWEAKAGTRLRVYERVDHAVIRLADAICPMSPDLHETLRRARVPPARIHPILNAVDVAEVDAVPVPSRSADEVRVGYIGRLAPHKNVDCLIEALARLGARHPSVRAVIAGDGPCASSLRALTGAARVTGRVSFVGYRPDALATLKSLDVFVLPSRYEGIPRSVMEAMAAGVPVIAADIPGSRMLLTHGETGLLYPAGDSSRLAAALETLLDDPGLGQSLAKRARARVEAGFSAPRMAGEYLELYERCLGSSS